MRSEEKAYFVYVWEFIVRDEKIEDFVRIYGPSGDWVKLFSKADGYLRSTLYQDITNRKRFVTSDYWQSREAHDQFKSKYQLEYDKLDRQCENFTVEEKFWGDFDIVQ